MATRKKTKVTKRKAAAPKKKVPLQKKPAAKTKKKAKAKRPAPKKRAPAFDEAKTQQMRIAEVVGDIEERMALDRIKEG